MMELDPEARRILSLARAARTPGDEAKTRVARRLSGVLGASAGASVLALSQTARAASTLKTIAGLSLVKWGAGGGGLLAVAALTYFSSAPQPPHAAPPAHVQVPVPAALAEQSPAPHPSEQVEAEPPEPARAAARPRQSTRAAPDPSVEIELLHRAQRAWRDQRSPQALSLIEEHRRRFPRSELALERDALEVLARCELGQRARAAQLARRLLASAPESPLRASIEQSCALR